MAAGKPGAGRPGGRLAILLVVVGLILSAAGIVDLVRPIASTSAPVSAPAKLDVPAHDSATVAYTSAQAERRDSQAVAAASNILDRPVNGVAFTMRVPVLAYSATVLEGVDSAPLAAGPGHYPKSAWPGHAGTVGVAAHNVYWLDFGNLRVGDVVEIQTRRAEFLYAVTDMKVTDPNDRSVIVPSTDHRLALTTCYPLWAGAYATQRLIFFGRETAEIDK